jgi:hypothetical protein
MLTADQVTPPGRTPQLRVLSCPSCGALRLRANLAIEKGTVEVEDFCRRCGTRTLWTLDSSGDARYAVIAERKR